VIETYRSVLGAQGLDASPLHLDLHNEIPLGMGCGSSAAALVAGVALASHFGKLGWTRERILTEASIREGHPDNVAACVLGGLTVSSMTVPVGADASGESPSVDALAIQPRVRWPLLVVMPQASLSTKKARALLPESYSKADTIFNVQRVAMLTAAFAEGRGDLLGRAMADRVHQPYRSAACPLLPLLLPLAGRDGVLGVALSGAGPSVLLLLEERGVFEGAKAAVQRHLEAGLLPNAEFYETEISEGAVIFSEH
jgi:homoserine kinase